MSLTPDRRRQFIEVACLFYKDAQILSKGLAPELARASKASAAMGKSLAAGRDGSKTSQARGEFDHLLNTNDAVFATINDLVGDAQRQLGGLANDPEIPEITGDMATQKRDTLAFGQALVHFFHGSALMSMQASLGSYIRLCEAYLGHKVGSHSVRKRITPVLKEGALLLGGMFIPGKEVFELFPLAVEGVKAARESTELADAEAAIRDAKGRDRQILLTNSLDTARNVIKHNADMAASAVDGVVSERSAFIAMLNAFSLEVPAIRRERPSIWRRMTGFFRRSQK